MRPTPFIIDVSNPEARGLLASTGSEQLQTNLSFVRRDGRARQVRFVERNTNEEGQLFDDVSFGASAVVEVAIGDADAAPTSGTWGLSFNGSSTGLTALAHNITAAALETVLNANAAIIAVGGVTVTQDGGIYVIAFDDVGAQPLFVFDDGTLLPPVTTTDNVVEVVVGDASTREVQLVILHQGYLAYSNDFLLDNTGNITATQIQSGDATRPEIQRITIDDNVKGGAWTLNAQQAGIYRITCRDNDTPYDERATWTYTNLNSMTIAGAGSTFFDIEDSAGIVRVWFDKNNGSTAPATPSGGRLLEVDFADPLPSGYGSEVVYFGALLEAKFTADGKFILDMASVSTGTIRCTEGGVRTIASNGTWQAALVRGLTGDDGPYQDTYFLLSDAYGTVGVKFACGGRSANVPETVEEYANASRHLIITTVTGGMTAAQVLTAVVSALDADAAWSCTNQTTYAALTMTDAGFRPTPDNGTAPVSIATQRAGRTLAGVFTPDASASDISAVIGEIFSVTQSDDHQWDLVALENGVQPTLTVSGSGLTFSEQWIGTLNLATWPMFLAFEGEGEEITTTFEVQVTESGENPVKALNMECTVRRDVILAGIVSGGQLVSEAITFNGTITGYTGGTVVDLDSISTASVGTPRLLTFIHSTDGQRWYRLTAGTTAESSPMYIRPDDYNGTTNAKVWVSVG